MKNLMLTQRSKKVSSKRYVNVKGKTRSGREQVYLISYRPNLLKLDMLGEGYNTIVF